MKGVSLFLKKNKSFLNIGGILDVFILGFISPILDKQHVHLKAYWQHFVDVPKVRSFVSILSSLFSTCRVVGTFILPILLLTFTVLLKLVTLFQEILNLLFQASPLKWRIGASSIFQLFHLQFSCLKCWIVHKALDFIFSSNRCFQDIFFQSWSVSPFLSPTSKILTNWRPIIRSLSYALSWITGKIWDM